jgi:hypothetical protein
VTTNDNINQPAGLRVYRREDGQFEAAWGGKTAVLRIVRCFPWTDPSRFVSLRDQDDHEIALIRDLASLDADSHEAVEAALAEAAFVLEVTRIDRIAEEFEIRNWRVQTRQGPRTFQTHRDDWPHPIHGGGFLVRDVAGDLFQIPPPEHLDVESRKRLRVYID